MKFSRMEPPNIRNALSNQVYVLGLICNENYMYSVYPHYLDD